MERDKTPVAPTQLAEFVSAHRGWALEGGQLQRVVEFPTFLGGIAFVQQLAAVAETMAHHPDLDIRYTKITVRLFSHDAHAVTSRDLQLAAECDRLATQLGGR